MNFICTGENLKRAVSLIERFTGKNINLPILSNILIKTDKNSVIFSATNLEIGSEISCPAKVVKDGSITVPSRIFSQIIQSLNEEKIHFESKNNILEIKTDDNSIKINGVEAKDFPIIPRIKKIISSFNVGYAEFISALNMVLPSVSQSDIKPEISGVFISISGNTMTIAGTDTFRLSEKKIKMPAKSEQISFIIPLKTAQEISRLSDNGGELKIQIGDNQIEFYLNENFFISNLVDGKFPEYSSIIPKNYESRIEVNRDEIVKKIKISSIFSSKLNDVKISVNKDILKIETANHDLGENVSIIKIQEPSSPASVLFNYRYLLDGLEAVKEEDVVMEINGDTSPTLIRGKGDNSFVYVVMPIKNSS